MASTVAWTSFSMPHSLVNVGTEALCMLCDNILCFMDLKTMAMTYYKAESPELGLSISAMTGHNRFALLAFAEVVFRPSVHIIQYPQMSKYAVFTNQDIITFVDIRFTEYDLLLALSGYPNYSICVWNFRTGQLLIQHDTMRESLTHSLLCSYHHIPQIVQYSESHKQLMVWEICYTGTGVDLHEISRITLAKEHTLSNIFSMCYGEDNNLYVVDNFGSVSMIQVAQFYLKLQWSVSVPNNSNTVPTQHYLYSHKQGLLVQSRESIYFLRKKNNVWSTEWELKHEQIQEIFKLTSNAGSELFAADAVGNLHQIDVTMEKVSSKEIYTFNNNSMDFVILKGVKVECLIQLTKDSKLRAVDMGGSNILSYLAILNANTIAAHNVDSYVVVGTTMGKLHFINYGDVKAPQEVAVLQTENGFSVASLKLHNKLALYRNTYFEFYLVQADFKSNKFFEIAPLVKIPDDINVCQYFLAEDWAFIFLNRDEDIKLPHARELWSFSWNSETKQVTRHEYQLAQTYRDVTDMAVSTKGIVEFYAVRLESAIMDILNFKMASNELIVVASIRTNHLSNINGIVGSKNLLTWGVDGTFIHYRSYKNAEKAYEAGQMLQIKYRPRVVKKVVDCFNAKYLVYLYSSGGMKVMNVISSEIAIVENSYVNMDAITLAPHTSATEAMASIRPDIIVKHSAAELETGEKLLQKLQEFSLEVSNLIDYDILVTGKTHGVYRKFCLHYAWLEKLIGEAKKLCELEKKSLEAAVKDQTRIRDWIRNLIMANSDSITFKIRALFSNFCFENYGRRKRNDWFSKFYDLYRLYEMQNIGDDDDNIEDELSEQIDSAGDKDNSKQDLVEARKYLKLQGSAYDHIMSEELALQDIDNVTANQMYNHDAKIRIALTDCLKVEFNGKFEETHKTKHDLMETILGINSTLNKIYDNMNTMLRLLKMDTFELPELSVPLWQNDEFIERIMEVDDSEIKAVNRRRKKDEVTPVKPGRRLLWSIDFWVRALVVMMDGVLEKLWEDEIKKEIPLPEFMLKKEPSDYTQDDQRALREYEEKVRLLTADRKKYLKILSEKDVQTNDMKANYILKLNEHITQMMMMKLKYDFTIKHVRLRNQNIKIMYFKKLQWLKRIALLRADVDKIDDYILRYTKLADFWAKSVDDQRSKGDNLMLRDKVIERQFKTQYLNTIPQHMGPEMNKAFKKRPKLSTKILHSTLICKELSMRVNTKVLPKYPFPLPKDVDEYLETLNASDDNAAMPNALEARYWEPFTKMRRQKIEIELKLKAVNLQLADSVAGMNYFNKELLNLKNTKYEAYRQVQEAQEEYLKSVQDQTLELRLTMGQVELNVMGSLSALQNCVLMHIDDINDINALILKAGQMKLRAMQRVAFFRRQVIFKEWEHKVVSANIEYLKYILYVIEKCKVSMEFLNILRNWQKIKADKQRLLNTVGLIEKTCEDKQIAYRRQLERLSSSIMSVRHQIDEMKRSNKTVNRQIDEVKVAVAFSTTSRDFLIEDKKRREQNEKMEKLKKRSQLIDTVRRDFAHVMELKTILELQRLRTYPTLGPNPDHCMK